MEPTNDNNLQNNTAVPNQTAQPQQAFVPAPVQPQQASVTTPVQPVPEVKKEKLSILNWGILLLVVLTLITWFYPLPADCGYRGAPAHCTQQLPVLLGTPIMILSFIVGSLFLGKMLMITDEKNAFMKVSGLLFGLLGGGFIFIVGVITGFIGWERSNGSV